MKQPGSLPRCRTAPRGVALVIVLSMLVLLSALVIAFLTTAQTERAAASANSGVTSAREIADSTVSLVISQIREATTASANSSGAQTVTWASQPGAIRTFGGTLSQGGKKQILPLGKDDGSYYDIYSPASDDAVFKLYSSDKLKVTSADYASTELPAEIDVINKWDPLVSTNNVKNYPDFVDLNEPILSPRLDLDTSGATVDPHYPIIDPRARFDATDKSPSGSDPGLVDGFDAKTTPDPKLVTVGLNGLKTTNGVPYLPMPVQWLYIFRDGTTGPASLGTDTNPIVGRTAFWTDDESCKLNINTAYEGTFWETPTASDIQLAGHISGGSGAVDSEAYSMQLASSQPVNGEYQRYPGHPATTCLSPVLGQFWGVLPVTSASNKSTPVYSWLGGGANTTYNKFKEAIYQILPYAAFGKQTSQDATRNTDVDGNKTGRPQNVATKHLYSSVDEMLFKQIRNDGPTGYKPEMNTPLTPDALERTRFFLTANSRAPELNLFGRPRVNVWPISASPNYRTEYDDLFAFASTIYKDPSNLVNKDIKYSFVRWEAKSPTMDLLGNWTGFGNGQFVPDNDNVNVNMLAYLQKMTDKPIPGFSQTGFSSTSKWGQDDRDEILTMIFDYMRSVNLVDTGTSANGIFAPYTPRFFTPKIIMDYARLARSYDWSGQVTPTDTSYLKPAGLPGFNGTPPSGKATRGLGRFAIPSEVALVFYLVPPATAGAPQAMKCAMIIEMAQVMAGYPALRDTYYTVVRSPSVQDSGHTVVKVAVGNVQTAADIHLVSGAGTSGLVNIVNLSSHETGEGRSYMPTLGWLNSIQYFPEWPKWTAMQSSPDRVDPVHPGTIPEPTSSYVVTEKTFTNSSPFSAGWAADKPAPQNGTLYPGGYVRGKTVTIYPYVSDPVVIGGIKNADGKAATAFTLKGGSFDIEIHAGEAPGDPRDAGIVQTVHVVFPDVPSMPLPTGTVSDFATRFHNQAFDGDQDGILAGDVVRSVELTCNGGAKDGTAGDLRLAAALSDVPFSYYTPRDGLTAYQANVPKVHGLQWGHGNPNTGNTDGGSPGLFVANSGVRTDKPPILPTFVKGVKRADGGPGDWDRFLSKHMDGALGNKVDEGNLLFDYTDSSGGGMPYYRGRNIADTGQTFFSPNRQLPSAVMFGSIPTGVMRTFESGAPHPWETLLFHPSREASTTHPGADTTKGPPDHLLLDLFNIPVVEPYAISEPFSTAGKINLNYVIAPFGYAPGASGNNLHTTSPRSYIRRDTALRGLLKSQFMMAVPTGQQNGGHTEDPYQATNTQLYFPIFLNRTLDAMEIRLKAKDGQYPLFRSASEYCTVDLYPLTSTSSDATSISGKWSDYWTANGLTGDNMRERPYADIYPRVTTKSNIYTVHMRCQAIRKSSRSPANVFDPKLDQTVGEYRGSATIERFIDPNDTTLKNYTPDVAGDLKQPNLDGFYRYRVVNTKLFAPQ